VPTSTIPPLFTGRMPFLPPNQQCQSTEGSYRIWIGEKMLEFSSMVLPAPSPYRSGQSNLTKRPHRYHTWTVQWYLPGGPSVHPT